MSQCTCTKDKEATCIVHPTTRDLKYHIAELEQEVAELESECEKAAKYMVELSKTLTDRTKRIAEQEQQLAELREAAQTYIKAEDAGMYILVTRRALKALLEGEK